MTVATPTGGTLLGRVILEAGHWNRSPLPGLSNADRGKLEIEAAAIAGVAFFPFFVLSVYFSDNLVPDKWQSSWRWGPICFVVGVALITLSAAIQPVEVKTVAAEYVVGTAIILPFVLLLCCNSEEPGRAWLSFRHKGLGPILRWPCIIIAIFCRN
jgi:hypothetical protein